MIHLKQKQQIIVRHLNGESNRQIAADLHISKNTVNKYVQEYDQKRAEILARAPDTEQEQILQDFMDEPSYDARSRMPVKVTPELTAAVEECLRINAERLASGMGKQAMRKKDIHEYLQQKGFDVSYSTVKRLTKTQETRHAEAYIKQEYSPGDVCEFDWGEVKLNIGGSGFKRYQMAVFTAAYSGLRFAALFPAQDTAAFQESHARFFAACHGAFHTMVYDNMRVAVRKFVGPTEKEPTKALLELSLYYGFQFRFCNVRRGNEKGHVERSVDVVRHKAFSKPGEDQFPSLQAANEHLANVCSALGQAKASNGTIPAELFQDEQAHLMPDMPRFDSCVKTACSVDKYATITVAGNHYSVPDTLVGKCVQVRLYTAKVVVYHQNAVVASHERSYEKNDWKIDIFHYLRTLRRKPGALAGSTALLQSDGAVKRIYEMYYTDNAKEFLNVLELVREYGTQPVQAALQRLTLISPMDMSAEKVRVLVHQSMADEQPESASPSGIDRISEKAKSTLSQYDLLRSWQGKERNTV